MFIVDVRANLDCGSTAYMHEFGSGLRPLLSVPQGPLFEEASQ